MIHFNVIKPPSFDSKTIVSLYNIIGRPPEKSSCELVEIFVLLVNFAEFKLNFVRLRWQINLSSLISSYLGPLKVKK